MKVMPKIISPLKIHGGKAYLSKQIIQQMKYRHHYIEPFFGGGNVFLNIDESFHNIYLNDINQSSMAVFNEVKNNHINFKKLLINKTPTDKITALAGFELSKEFGVPANFPADILYVNRFSRAANNKSFGWSDRLRRGVPEYLSAWDTMINNLMLVSTQLRHANLSCADFQTFLGSPILYSLNNAVCYCDPPYLHETRISKKAYTYEMTEGQHIFLINILKQKRFNQGWISYLSGYKSDLYMDMLGDPVLTMNVTCPSSQLKVKPRRQEMLWMV